MNVFDRPVLSVAGRTYRWSDVLIASHLWGGWQALVDWTANSLRLLDVSHAEGDESQAEVDAAAEEFRYERDLLSAEELDAWLSDRALDAGAWLDHIRRAVLVARDAPRKGRPRRTAPLVAEVAGRLWVDGVCRGELARLAEAFAGRIAVHESLVEGEGFRCPKKERATLMASIPRTPDTVLGLASTAREAEQLACAEIAYERFAAAAASSEAIAGEVVSNEFAWTRVTYNVARVPDADQAEEMAMIVREDGSGLAVAAGRASVSCEEASHFLQDASEEEREMLVGAAPGDLVGPAATTRGFVLVEVVDRRAPEPRDTVVAERAREALVRRAVEREVARRVTWHHRI